MSKGQEYYNITVFSPEGKLYQVEYAFKAVKTSNLTSIGIRAQDGVVLLSEKKVGDKFIDPASVTNLHHVSPYIGTLLTGIPSDMHNILYRLRM
jgi:20S proteasome subunit alpha 1